MREVHSEAKYSSVWHHGKLSSPFLYPSHGLMALHLLRAKVRADHHHHTWKEKHSWDEAEYAASFLPPVTANLMSWISTNVTLWDRFLQFLTFVCQKCLCCWLLSWITWTHTHFLHGHLLQEPRGSNSSPCYCCNTTVGELLPHASIQHGMQPILISQALNQYIFF